MKNQDPDQDFVNHLALNTLDHLVARAPVPSPGLDKRFRCPIDGSTTTQAIQQILDEACTSWVVDGKTVAAQANSPLLQKYRPGQKPRIRYEFLPVSFLLLFFALATAQQWSSSVGLFQSLLLLVFAGGAFLLFWASRQDLPREMAKWEVRGPRPNFLDHQEGVINGRQSWNRQGHAGGEPLRSSRRQGAAHALLLLEGPAARVENP